MIISLFTSYNDLKTHSSSTETDIGIKRDSSEIDSSMNFLAYIPHVKNRTFFDLIAGKQLF